MRNVVFSVAACMLVTHVAVADWPQFRGPNAAGVVTGPSPPIEFGPGKRQQSRMDGRSIGTVAMFKTACQQSTHKRDDLWWKGGTLLTDFAD